MIYIYRNFESHWESIFRCFQSNDILFWIFSSQPIKPNYFTMTTYTVSKHILTKWKNTALKKNLPFMSSSACDVIFYEQVNQILLCESVNQNQWIRSFYWIRPTLHMRITWQESIISDCKSILRRTLISLWGNLYTQVRTKWDRLAMDTFLF
jgi:hypothetical protein